MRRKNKWEQLRQKRLKQLQSTSFYSCKLTAIEGLTPLIIHIFLSIPSDKADKDDPVFTCLPFHHNHWVDGETELLLPPSQTTEEEEGKKECYWL